MLVHYRRSRLLGRMVKELLALYGVEIPSSVEIGRDLTIMHRGFGTVVHPSTILGDRVTLYHGVTIGRADGYDIGSRRRYGGIRMADDVVICAGAAILGGETELLVGEGTVIGANAVLTRSTGEWEIWVGNPARRIGSRVPAENTE
jgi:serine O-acetyltransferase